MSLSIYDFDPEDASCVRDSKSRKLEIDIGFFFLLLIWLLGNFSLIMLGIILITWALEKPKPMIECIA